MTDAPLFILAPPRSFTSVLCGVIGQHPQMMGLPEVNLFGADTVAGLDRWHGTRPRLRHGLLRAVAELGFGGQSEEDVEAAEAWLREVADQPTAAIFRDLAEWAAPRRLVDKSPLYVLDEGALERIHAAFPDARYIHLTRHPWATLRSMVGLRETIQQAGGFAGMGGRGVGVDRYWLEPHLRVKEFLDSLPARRWMRVRGEDVMGSPDLFLPQLAEWLGLRTDAEAVAAMKRPEESPFARRGPANARWGNDPGFMDSPALRPWHDKGESLDDPPPPGVEGEAGDALRHHARLWGYA